MYEGNNSNLRSNLLFFSILHRRESSIVAFKDLQGRSSRSQVFCKNVVLENFTNLTGKHLCHNLFFNKVAGPAILFKKRLEFFCDICEIFKNTFFYKTPQMAASVCVSVVTTNIRLYQESISVVVYRSGFTNLFQ